MPNLGKRVVNWLWWCRAPARLSLNMSGVPCSPLKSIVMTLTPATTTWARSMVLITDRALSCNPFGSTGRVSHTASAGVRARCRVLDDGHAVGPRRIDA